MNNDIFTPDRPIPYYVLLAFAMFGVFSMMNDLGIFRLMNLPDMPLYARAAGACGGMVGIWLRLRFARQKKSDAIQ